MWWKLLVLFGSSILVVNFPFVPTRPAYMALYFSKDINFLLVALTCIIGTTIGVIPMYGATYKASEVKKIKRWMEKRWVKKFLNPIKHNMFLVIVLINITPLPDVLIGVIGGGEKYNFKKFILANIVGRVIFYMPFALIGHYFAGDVQVFEDWLIKIITNY